MDLLSELATLDPWLLRGWLYLASPSYRARRHEAWRTRGIWYSAADITLSVGVMALEIAMVVWIVA